ncbi:MAG: DUF4870 domain-containing protein [Dehalococcoidia bacterium]
MYCPSCGTENDEGGGFCKQCGASLGAGRPASGGQTTSLEPNVAGLLCYVLGWLTGLIFILIEKEDRFVRFHAMQSIAVFGGLTVLMILLSILAFIPVIGILFYILQILVGLAGLILWILLMVRAYQGNTYKVPIAGKFAEGHI